jgi:hypothetical protein
MNFKRLASSTTERSTTSTESKLVRTFRSVKNWFVPRTAEGRKIKYSLYKDLGLFIVFTTLIVMYRNDIQRALEEDPVMSEEGFSGLGL